MMMPDEPITRGQSKSGMRRRDFLKTALGTASLAAVAQSATARSKSRTRSPARGGSPTPGGGGAASADAWAQEVFKYLESLRRADGGYAWGDQAQSHLTPTFGAVGCYHLLGQEPPDEASLVAFLRTHHPFAIKKLERDLPVFDFQQIQSLLWLGQEVGSFREQVKKWIKPSGVPGSL